jgi:PAS domain-containing protein
MGAESYEGSMMNSVRSFCITNPLANDCPIAYASPGFVELTGYPIGEILGRNCRFLQGQKTDPNEVREVMDELHRHSIES